MADEKKYVARKRDYTATLIFASFLGALGAHRFYTGYIGIGIIQLLTGGGCGIWALIDIFCLCFSNYEDYEGNELMYYNPTLGKIVFVIVLIIIISVIASRPS